MLGRNPTLALTSRRLFAVTAYQRNLGPSLIQRAALHSTRTRGAAPIFSQAGWLLYNTWNGKAYSGELRSGGQSSAGLKLLDEHQC